MNLNDLQTFLRVVEAGNFTQAAKQLGVPKSTVSRRIARLEDALGVELLVRKPRSFAISHEGQKVYDRTAPSLRDVADLEREFCDDHRGARGELRVTAAQDFGASSVFARMLARFKRRYPEVVPIVELTMRRVDLVEEGFDVAFRMHGPPLQDVDNLVTRRIATMSSGLFASPSYLERRGYPHEPADLATHDVLGFSAARGRLVLRDEQGRRAAVSNRSPAFCANDLSLLRSLAIEAAGIAMLPDFAVSPLPGEGVLAAVLPGWRLEGGSMSALWPRSRHMAPRVRAFIDHAVETFGGMH
jgi:DNA-binding transcriptional LysR family regulator